MARQEFELEVRSSAPPEELFAIVADGSRWPSCTPIGSFALEPPDTTEHVGAVRIFRTGPIASRERIVESEPPNHFAYVLVRGLPVRGYRSDIHLRAVEGGTSLRWRSTFWPKIPGTGWLFRFFLKMALQRSAEGIARAAEGH
jgi:hypothetical protein